MKLSAKKKGEIYDLVESHIQSLRDEVDNIFASLEFDKAVFKIDYIISKSSVPIAQKIMKLLDNDYRKEMEKKFG